MVKDLLAYVILNHLAEKLEITQNYLQFYDPKLKRMVQIVFRIYHCISELVQTFDIDCCGVCYYDGKLLATEKAIYARENMVNHASPDAVTLTWASRLGKYVDRGFSLVLPKFDKNRFDMAGLKKEFGGNVHNCLVIMRKTLEMESRPREKTLFTPQNVVMIGSVLDFIRMVCLFIINIRKNKFINLTFFVKIRDILGQWICLVIHITLYHVTTLELQQNKHKEIGTKKVKIQR